MKITLAEKEAKTATDDFPKNEGFQAARIETGPTLILAGPGTGKTHCLGFRLKWLIEEKKFSPDEVTVLTFTTEAARNMRERISDTGKADVYIHPGNQPKRICTMHSLGLAIVRDAYALLGLKTDSPRLVTSELLRHSLFQDAAQLAGFSRALGDEACNLRQKGVLTAPNGEIAKVWDCYDAIMTAENAVDYDDQIRLALKALQSDSDLLAKWAATTRQLLIDEYQDINEVQFLLIKLLSQGNPVGLFAVGDDDQSIYSFRGGDPVYAQQFCAHFGEAAKIVPLKVCRRCPQKVFKSALAVVTHHNTGRVDKPAPVFLDARDGCVELHSAPTQEIEGRLIASHICDIPNGSSALILVPSAPYASPVREALDHKGIGYISQLNVPLKGIDFMDAIRVWLRNPKDSLAFRHMIAFLLETRVYDIPPIKSRKDEKLLERANKLGQIATLWNLVLKSGFSLYEALQNQAEGGKDSFLQSIVTAAKKLLDGVKDSSAVFLSSLGEVAPPWHRPEDMLSELEIVSEELGKKKRSGSSVEVRLMSLQLAKGLEADYVYVIGLDEGIFPKADWSDAIRAEKSRLLYVAMTRAKQELHLYTSRKRTGDIVYTPGSFALKASSFLDCIPKGLIETNYIQAPSKVAKKKQKQNK